MTINGGTILAKTTASSESMGIYNNAILTINNTSITALTNASHGLYATGLMLSDSSSTTILSGTISGAGAGIESNGNLTLGSNDNNVSTTTPLIEGLSNNGDGIKFGSSSIFNFYDGIIKSRRGQNYTMNGEPANMNVATGYMLRDEQIDGVYTTYLKLPK